MRVFKLLNILISKLPTVHHVAYFKKACDVRSRTVRIRQNYRYLVSTTCPYLAHSSDNNEGTRIVTKY